MKTSVTKQTPFGRSGKLQMHLKQPGSRGEARNQISCRHNKKQRKIGKLVATSTVLVRPTGSRLIYFSHAV